MAERCAQGVRAPVRSFRARPGRIRSSEETHVCPACITSTAVMVAGTGCTGGILAVASASSEKFSERVASVCFRKKRRNDMTTSKERDMEQLKGNLPRNTPPIVSPQEWEAARRQHDRGCVSWKIPFQLLHVSLFAC